MLDVAIIGCGVVGAAAAYELSHYPLHTAIFEAENDVADCTTKANSAILHAGYDPEPGTRMARLNVEGVALAKEICARLDVPYRQCGSLVLALSPAELPHLQKLYENGLANGVPGIRLLSAEETRAMEPGLSPEVAGALYAPSAAIVSPWEYALAMAEVAVRNGVELHLSSPVTGIQKTASGWALTTTSGVVEARYVASGGVGAGLPTEGGSQKEITAVRESVSVRSSSSAALREQMVTFIDIPPVLYSSRYARRDIPLQGDSSSSVCSSMSYSQPQCSQIQYISSVG